MIIYFKYKDMNKAIVSKTFSPKKYKDSDLLRKASSILEQMSNNVNFAESNEKQDTLRLCIQNFRDAIVATFDGGKMTTVVKRDCRRKLENALQEMADYVQELCRGNAAVVYSAGFDIHKKPSKVGALDKPLYVKIEMGSNKGCVVVSCAVVERALFYVFEYRLTSEMNENAWIQVSGSRRKMQINGLTSGQEYSFRVAAARTHPSRIWSEVVKSYVI